MSFNSGYIVSTFLMEVLTIANKERDLPINDQIRSYYPPWMRLHGH